MLAFEEAGGVPEEILYDRMKQVVLESYRNRVVMHPLFNAMRLHYGDFKAVPLAPGYKEGKGKVENPFRYVEANNSWELVTYSVNITLRGRRLVDAWRESNRTSLAQALQQTASHMVPPDVETP